MHRTLLITGANGFVGRHLIKHLAQDPTLKIRAAVRTASEAFPATVQVIPGLDLTMDAGWVQALEGVDCVVHCAARVHVMNEIAADPLAEFRKCNVEGSRRLAQYAAQAGVRRYVFLSSLKVNGEATTLGHPFLATDIPHPTDPYGLSKIEAERTLQTLAAATGMEVVIVRPPLVYGPGVKANFLTMMRWLNRGIPLPLGAVHNARSFVALDNLVSLLALCTHHPAAAGQVFLVSDDQDLSTTELLRRMAIALGKRPLLLPVPAYLLKAAAALLGKADMAQRLLGSLQVDITATKERLGWQPPLTVDEGLQKAAEGITEKTPSLSVPISASI